MPLPVHIRDGKNDRAAGVTRLGELIVAPIEYSIPYYVSVNVAATSFEVVQGKASKYFVVTSLLLASDKTFGTATTAETLTIYEANPADLDTSEKVFVQIDFLKNERMPVAGLNLLVSEAKSLVATATDTNADVTIAGYYVDA